LTAEAYKAGVKICTGTDDDQEQFAALIAATENGAEAIGIEKTQVTPEEGKIVDVVVLNKPLEKIENIYRCLW